MKSKKAAAETQAQWEFHVKQRKMPLTTSIFNNVLQSSGFTAAERLAREGLQNPVDAHRREADAPVSEEYIAAFIECVISGSTDPSRVDREKIRKALARNRSLRERIEQRKKQSKTIGGGDLIVWEPEDQPVRKVILKLARCHAAYELNEPQLDGPAHFFVAPLLSLSQEQKDHFEDRGTRGDLVGWPEVGSRAMQRLLIVGDGAYSEGWVTVQEGRYRYVAVGDSEVTIRGVLSEYLAYEVIWTG